MKKLLAFLVCFTMICGITGCASSEEYEIAMITDSGSVTDKSFNQSAYEGVKEFSKKNNLTYKYYAPKDTDKAGLLETVGDAVDNGAKIIVTPGFNFATAIYEAQEKYPDVKFICIDYEPADEKGNVKVADNTICYLFQEHESGYMAGYAAVKEGYTKLGFVGGMALPAVENYGVGYLKGASDAAQELNVNVDVNYTYTGTFVASPEIKTLSASWYNSGTEVIFTCGGQICTSVFAAAQEANKLTIGVDTDQSEDSETVITSALKDVKGATKKGLQLYLDDKFTGGETVVFKNTGDIVYPNQLKNLSEEDYNAVKAKVADGSLGLKSFAELAGELSEDEEKSATETGDPSAMSFPNVTIHFQ